MSYCIHRLIFSYFIGLPMKDCQMYIALTSFLLLFFLSASFCYLRRYKALNCFVYRGTSQVKD